MKRILMIAVLLTLTLAAGAEPALEIEAPWVREPNPARPIASAFMTIINTSDNAITLVGARSEAAEVVEIHDMQTVDGVMKMRMLGSLEIPANSSVKLEPGGLHLMMIRLTRELKAGDEVEIELEDDSGTLIKVTASVRKAEMHH